MKSLLYFLSFFVLVSSVAAQNFESSNLPILLIKTNGQTIPDNDKITAEMKVIDNGLGKTNKLSDPPNNYNGKIGIELRGSSSQSLSPKKPYTIETRDDKGASIDVPLMGLAPENDWVLLAPYADKSLIRDPITYDLARKASSKYWIPKYRFCEVFVDERYQGVYILAEKIKKGKNRVDISSLKPTDESGDALTGGYLIKNDKFTGNPSSVIASNFPSLASQGAKDIFYQIDYPKLADITKNQAKYIEDYLGAFENTLRNSNFRDPVNGYQRFANLDSFVDYMLVTELTGNLDGYRSSTYFFKNKESKGGKLTMGPLWDYNLAYGNGDFCEAWKTTGFQFQQYKVPFCNTPIPFWWERLLQDSTFARVAVTRWKTLRKTVWDTDKIIELIDSSAASITQAQIRNFTRWNILGTKVWPNYYVGKNYSDEIVQLKTYIRNRTAWLDAEFTKFYELTTALSPEVLAQTALLRVSPNPIIDKAVAECYVPKAGLVSLKILSANAQQIQSVFDGNKPKGVHFLEINLPKIPAGIYLLSYTLDGQLMTTQKLIVN
jgi:spore coat protein CotH